jgi:2-dehydro-3-deoxyphosphooctonate aldolase (KDO 8-P synthase)
MIASGPRADSKGNVLQLINRFVGGSEPLFLIAGPCVIESEEICLRVADTLARIRDRLNILVIFKASFDKANRTSGEAYRGPGIEEGLAVLEKVREQSGLPVITDVHETWQVPVVAPVVDMLQIPAMLCRQTDLIAEAVASGKPVNIKKGQFMAPEDMRPVVEKCGKDAILTLCERGTSFGYRNLVVDMRSLEIMREFGPVVFDATHSVQRPGANGWSSGGDARFAPALARAAVAVGVAGLFMETHPDPGAALSDGPNSIPLDAMPDLIGRLVSLDEITKR